MMLGGFVIDILLAPIRAMRERIEDLVDRVYWMGFTTGAAVAVALMLALWLISQRRQ